MTICFPFLLDISIRLAAAKSGVLMECFFRHPLGRLHLSTFACSHDLAHRFWAVVLIFPISLGGLGQWKRRAFSYGYVSHGTMEMEWYLLRWIMVVFFSFSPNTPWGLLRRLLFTACLIYISASLFDLLSKRGIAFELERHR